MAQQNNYRIYSIGSKKQDYNVNLIDSSQFYTYGTSCRKAYLSQLPYDREQNQEFTDHKFPPTKYKSQAQSKPLGDLRRLFQLYDKEFNLFDSKYFQPSDIDIDDDRNTELPTFLSQFSMIDREYIKTRFITKRLNKSGYYEYFIRRNGEYYVDYVDDFIPIVGAKKLPLWGLSKNEPWKIIIMKAWIKEKGGIEAVERAEPYEFIEAFGLPGYRALSIKKEVDHLHHSNISQSAMAERERKRTKLNVPGFITVGKTRDIENVKQMGLRRNRAGYKIIPIESNQTHGDASGLKVSSIINKQTIFKVQSQLPVYWVGDYSVASEKLLNSYNPKAHKLNFEKEFLASYSEISKMFSKFYITPEYSSKYFDGNVIQDSIRTDIDSEASCPHYFFELQVTKKGSININVDLPFWSGVKKQDSSSPRYSPIRYFLAKINEKAEGKFANYQFYDGQYVKGYHKSLNRFLEISEGKYLIYIKIQNQIQKSANFFTINISTNSEIRLFNRAEEMTVDRQAEIIKSTFFGYAKANGIRCYIHKTYKDLIVYICNKFDEIGFSFIALYCHENAKGSLALKANRNELKKHDIDICKQAHEAYGDEADITKLVAKPGQPQMLVLERTKRTKSKDQQFPPFNTIDFYEIL